MVVCTVAAVAVVPLTIDLYIPDGSADPTVGVMDIAGSTAVGVPSAPRTGEVSDRSGSTAIEPESAAAATAAPEPHGASTVPESLSDPALVEPLPGTLIGAATPSVVVPPPARLTPTSGAVADPVGESQFEAPAGGSTSDVTDVPVVGGPVLIDSGAGSGMGGDLPPEALPTPAYPQCPITESGSWWTDSADPYMCIPPDSIPFHEPTPPGIPPELLEPVFEAPVAPEGSVGWYEPTPPGIDPSLLEPIMEDVGQPKSAE